jgi:Dyp-type peroxidase family
LAELPSGIYWDHGDTPPRCYGIAFLKADQSATAAEIDAALSALAGLWRALQAGSVPTLPGATVAASALDWVLGFGRKAFSITGARPPVPRNLRPPYSFNSIDPAGGGLAVDSSGLRFDDGLAQNVATEEFCVQFTGDTPLCVARAIVESALLLEGLRDPATGKAPLLVSASFTGFNREDRRSWIDFHDGVSNLESGDQRRSVIEVRPQGLAPGDRWTAGGTYMAFIRLRVDVRLWRQLDDDTQELVVGRKKVSGCPVVAAVDGAPVPIADCPAAGSNEVGTEPGNLRFLQPPDAVDSVTELSHVQRANHGIVRQRVYRQGYEFFEPPMPGRPFVVGLNFVSFQESPERLFFMLKTSGWLGDTNFGGAPGPELLRVVAGANFFCPPVDGAEPYPGASVFAPTPP